MPRIKFKKRSQIKFLDDIRKQTSASWPELAKILKVHSRTLSDWKRAQYTLPEKVFKKCIKITKGKVEVPPRRILPDFWSVEKAGRKGALARNKVYGNPGTQKGRKKGGSVSQQRRRLHPELYQHCNLRKNIIKPRETPKLAEFFGIVLGDGGISSHQVRISLNKENDKEYIYFICELIEKLFGITPAVYYPQSLRSKKVAEITVSAISLTEFLLSKGLKRGNKVKQQVGVPAWIKKRKELSRSCLRGLIDTDGGVYFHRHKSHGCKCLNIGLQLTNGSIPILAFAENILSQLNFTPKLDKRGKRHVNLYRESEVYRYAEEITFHNPYHVERLRRFSKQKAVFLRRDVGNW